VVVVAAAGNAGCTGNPANYPAAYPEVLAVAAVDAQGAVPCFSSHGSYVDVAAPGVDIVGPRVGGGKVTGDGTSFASPYVAGVVALLAGAHPTWTAGQLATIIRSTARDIGVSGWDEYSGNGVVSAASALAAPEPTPLPDDPQIPPPPPPAPAPDPTPAAPSGAPPSAATSPSRTPAPITVTGATLGRDAFEPNGSLRRARRYRTSLDLVRAARAAVTATIARSTDAVDIYAVRVRATRRFVRVTLTRTKGTAKLTWKVLTADRAGHLRVRCNARSKQTVRCPISRVGRIWIQVVAATGSARYTLRVR
jgi:hypothetical protein